MDEISGLQIRDLKDRRLLFSEYLTVRKLQTSSCFILKNTSTCNFQKQRRSLHEQDTVTTLRKFNIVKIIVKFLTHSSNTLYSFFFSPGPGSVSFKISAITGL